MSRSYRAVIFDMDGLILDTEPLYRRAWQAAGDALGFTIDDELYASLVGLRTEDSMAVLRERFGSAFRAEEFRERWLNQWKDAVRRNGIPRKDGFDELIARVERQDLRTAIATSTGRPRAGLSLRAAGLEGRFRVMVTGDEIENGKPSPDIYLEAARRLELEPHRCIVLEDSEPGVLSAHAAGMRVIMVPDVSEPSEDARKAAFGIVSSLHDVRLVLPDLNTESTSDQELLS